MLTHLPIFGGLTATNAEPILIRFYRVIVLNGYGVSTSVILRI